MSKTKKGLESLKNKCQIVCGGGQEICCKEWFSDF